jgi:hypothetical protein
VGELQLSLLSKSHHRWFEELIRPPRIVTLTKISQASSLPPAIHCHPEFGSIAATTRYSKQQAPPECSIERCPFMSTLPQHMSTILHSPTMAWFAQPPNGSFQTSLSACPTAPLRNGSRHATPEYACSHLGQSSLMSSSLFRLR